MFHLHLILGVHFLMKLATASVFIIFGVMKADAQIHISDSYQAHAYFLLPYQAVRPISLLVIPLTRLMKPPVVHQVYKPMHAQQQIPASITKTIWTIRTMHVI